MPKVDENALARQAFGAEDPLCAAQGVRLLSLEAGDRVAAAVVIAPVEENVNGNGGLIQ